ncbi:hypothetical protein BpHYR1_039642 [Brachionus plicatilis]|uniref:Uncharacterized protein n=1 Tax=Brachionus plicatilis TaxID=10195 RepID=A0A3M7S7T1_BRAPC|nr:hypothetical protein BpHYR1_039642 [Brachionus plicatilis]
MSTSLTGRSNFSTSSFKTIFTLHNSIAVLGYSRLVSQHQIVHSYVIIAVKQLLSQNTLFFRWLNKSISNRKDGKFKQTMYNHAQALFLILETKNFWSSQTELFHDVFNNSKFYLQSINSGLHLNHNEERLENSCKLGTNFKNFSTLGCLTHFQIAASSNCLCHRSDLNWTFFVIELRVYKIVRERVQVGHLVKVHFGLGTKPIHLSLVVNRIINLRLLSMHLVLVHGSGLRRAELLHVPVGIVG